MGRAGFCDLIADVCEVGRWAQPQRDWLGLRPAPRLRDYCAISCRRTDGFFNLAHATNKKAPIRELFWLAASTGFEPVYPP
jgi:hypothetical protein